MISCIVRIPEFRCKYQLIVQLSTTWAEYGLNSLKTSWLCLKQRMSSDRILTWFFLSKYISTSLCHALPKNPKYFWNCFWLLTPPHSPQCFLNKEKKFYVNLLPGQNSKVFYQCILPIIVSPCYIWECALRVWASMSGAERLCTFHSIIRCFFSSFYCFYANLRLHNKI